MAITAWEHTPRESEFPGLAGEEVLDTTPARRTEPAADSPVQDIVLDLPGDEGGDSLPPVTVTFTMDAPDLGVVVAETADFAYVLSGNPGLKAFHDALQGTTQPAMPSVFASLHDAPPRRGDKLYLDDNRTPLRGRLINELAAYLEQLPGRRSAAVEAVQNVAVPAAVARIETSRKQVIDEACRYLSLPVALGTAAAPEAAAAVLAGSGPNRLTGPETPHLVADLAAIANARAVLAGVVSSGRRAEQRWTREKLAMLSDDPARWGQRRPFIADWKTGQLDRDLAAIAGIPDSAEVTTAKQRVVDRRRELAELVADRAADRPVLYRLWDTEIPFVARRLRRGSNITALKALAADSAELRAAVLNRLRTTYHACAELTRQLDADPEIVWAFPPLIDEALTTLAADDGDFVTRVTRDRLLAEKPAADLRIWSDWLGYAQLAFALSGAAPIVVAATVAQVAVDVAAVVVKAFAAARQQIGEDAFLRPSARLGVPPSYSGAMLDALDIAIGVLTPLPVDTKLFRDEQ